MNLSKDQIQKILLGVIVVVAALYAYFTMLLGPLGERQRKAVALMEDLEPKIKDANIQLTRVRGLEKGDPNAAAAKRAREVIAAKIPTGAAIVWLPQRLTDFFSSHGIAKSEFKLQTEGDDPDLKEYRWTQWNVDLPEVEFGPLASALAALENQEALTQITFFKLEMKPDNVQFQSATLKLRTLAKK